jgi:peptidoglycan/xylan/chitin deacetylase (PgdA/CDA1 family)
MRMTRHRAARSATVPTTLAVLVVAASAGATAGCGAGTSARLRTGPAATAAPPVHPPSSSKRAGRVPPAVLPSAAAQLAAVRRLAALGRPIFCGGHRGRLVALTFDDGPGTYTRIALRELRRAGAQATFFLVGASIARYPTWPRRERGLGAIGNHTMTHPNLRSLSSAGAKAEVRSGRNAALAAAGAPVDLFRPPYGAHTTAVDQEARREGMAQILWNVDSGDSRLSPPEDYRVISANVRRGVGPGAIVLMHENRGQTIRALRAILPALQRRGLRSVTVPELLAADPPSRAQLAGGRRGCGSRGLTTGSGG